MSIEQEFTRQLRCVGHFDSERWGKILAEAALHGAVVEVSVEQISVRWEAGGGGGFVDAPSAEEKYRRLQPRREREQTFMSTETELKPEAVVGCKTWVGSEPQASNIDLGKDRITAEIRVSTAALLREDWWGKWWLIETWIFSDDPRQENRQIIHGDCGAGGGRPPHERICATARKVHRYVTDNLRRRFANVETGAEEPTIRI